MAKQLGCAELKKKACMQTGAGGAVFYEQQPPPPQDEESGRWRVKVYRLNGDGQWDDCGTGLACLNSSTIRVDREAKGDEDGNVVVSSPILSSDTYQKQGDNIVTWDSAARFGSDSSREAEKTSVALSFHEREDCSQFWERVLSVQAAATRQQSSSGGGGGGGAAANSPDAEDGESVHRAFSYAQQVRVLLLHILGARGEDVDIDSSSPLDTWPPLPSPRSCEAVETWASLLGRALPSPQGREKYGRELFGEKQSLLREFLVSYLNDAEDLDDVEGLRASADAAKLVVFLNYAPLTELIVDDLELYSGMLGALEYAADLKRESGEDDDDDDQRQPKTASAARRVPYRDLALRASKMKQVVPITDVGLKKLISQHFRASILRDALLRPGGEMAQLSVLHTLIHFDGDGILERLYHKTDYLSRVISRLESPTDCVAALKFLSEMTKLAKDTRDLVREQLYSYAVDRAKLFEALAAILTATGDPHHVAAVLDVTSAVVEFSPCLLRRHSLRPECRVPEPPPWILEHQQIDDSSTKNDGELSLLYWLCKLCGDANAQISDRACLAVRRCLDVDTMLDAEREAVLSMLYEQHYVEWIAAPLFLSGDDVESNTNHNRASRQRQINACDLLAYCVAAHTYRIKYFLMKSRVASRIVALASSSSANLSRRPVQLAAIRFLRSCVGARDDFFCRYLIKNASLAPIVSLLADASSEDTMVTSAVAEMCEFVRFHNLKPLVEHLVTSHADKLSRSATHAWLLEGLRARHAQNQEAPMDAYHSSGFGQARGGAPPPPPPPPPQAARERAEDREEAYFEEDESDEASNHPHYRDGRSISPRRDDDEGDDEREFRPPPSRQQLSRTNGHIVDLGKGEEDSDDESSSSVQHAQQQHTPPFVFGRNRTKKKRKSPGGLRFEIVLQSSSDASKRPKPVSSPTTSSEE